MEKFTPKLLRQLRKKAMLSQKNLAKFTGLSGTAIGHYEKGRYKPTPRKWQRIFEVLTNEDMWYVPEPEQISELSEPEPVEIPEPVKFTFTEGQYYTIRDVYTGRHYSDVNPATGKQCVFRYEGMKGIYHCFVEAVGGWRRTYTNAQLIGKEIREVQQ